MNIDPNKPADKPTEELTEKELDGVTGGGYVNVATLGNTTIENIGNHPM